MENKNIDEDTRKYLEELLHSARINDDPRGLNIYNEDFHFLKTLHGEVVSLNEKTGDDCYISRIDYKGVRFKTITLEPIVI